MKKTDTSSSCAHDFYAKAVSPPEHLPMETADSDSTGSGENRPFFMNDFNLAQQALNDLQVTEVLLRRVYPRIYAVVQSVVGRAHNVDDIVQLAAMEVTRCLDRYRGHGSIEAWAAKIAYRKAARVTKRDWKSRLSMVPLDDECFADKDTLNPEKTLLKDQLFDTLLSKMGRIPTKRRVPLLLHWLYGYSVREVSELTDVPINTVKDRLKTASREYRSILEKNHRLVSAMMEELP